MTKDNEQNTLSIKAFEWTPEAISRFWNLVALSPLTEFSFGRIAGAEAAQLIKHHVPPGNKVLDFGAGDGDIVELLLKEGYMVSAFEPSQQRSAAIHSKNLEQYPNFLGFNSPNSTMLFDCILLFEVLEHIHPAFLEQTLYSVIEKLAPGGKIIGTVPNDERLENAYCVCPHCASLFHRWQHMRSFDAEALHGLFDKNGSFNINIFQVNFAPSLAFVVTRRV